MQPNENTFLFDKTPAPEWEDKAAARAQLEKDVADYLARGGKITQCEPRVEQLTKRQKELLEAACRAHEKEVARRKASAQERARREAARERERAAAARDVREEAAPPKRGRPRLADLVAKHLQE